ncbi:MAG: hypothetical protein K6G90_14595 [Clostridia bacterium]|nr:hypothetical protein [Clostridia bacterium]
MKFNLSLIMKRAWTIFKKMGVTFGEALHRSWQAAKAEPVNAERIQKAKAEAGIVEETNTWAGWRDLGYMVSHGMKALFGCDLIYASKGDGEIYKARFFGKSQVEAIA